MENLEIEAKLEWNTKTYENLKKLPDETLFAMAKQTLDLTVSKEFIPMDTHRMKNSSVAGGVRGSNGDYYIGSYTSYASSVWRMPQDTTNWTNDKSKSQWFAYTLNRYKQTIIDTAINKTWKDNM